VDIVCTNCRTSVPCNGVDLKVAISKLKNGKATGDDQTLVELIKVGGKEFKKVIYELILKIWQEQSMPHECK